MSSNYYYKYIKYKTKYIKKRNTYLLSQTQKGGKYDPPSGISNVNSSCFMNASIQFLLRMYKFIDFVTDKDIIEYYNKDVGRRIGSSPENLGYYLYYFLHLLRNIKEFKGSNVFPSGQILQDSLRNEIKTPSGDTVTLQNIMNNRRVYGFQSSGSQEDSTEFLTHFMAQFNIREMDNITNIKREDIYKEKLIFRDLSFSDPRKSFLNIYFVEKYNGDDTCSETNKKGERDVEETFTTFGIVYPNDPTDPTALKRDIINGTFEQMDRGPRYGKICKYSSSYFYYYALFTFSGYLKSPQIHASLMNLIEEETLELNTIYNLIKNDPAKVRYNLVGIICHSGSDGVNSCGHYFAYINIEGIWYEYNDSTRTQLSNYDSVKSNIKSHSVTPYSLLYEYPTDMPFLAPSNFDPNNIMSNLISNELIYEAEKMSSDSNNISGRLDMLRLYRDNGKPDPETHDNIKNYLKTIKPKLQTRQVDTQNKINEMNKIFYTDMVNITQMTNDQNALGNIDLLVTKAENQIKLIDPNDVAKTNEQARVVVYRVKYFKEHFDYNTRAIQTAKKRVIDLCGEYITLRQDVKDIQFYQNVKTGFEQFVSQNKSSEPDHDKNPAYISKYLQRYYNGKLQRELGVLINSLKYISVKTYCDDLTKLINEYNNKKSNRIYVLCVTGHNILSSSSLWTTILVSHLGLNYDYFLHIPSSKEMEDFIDNIKVDVSRIDFIYCDIYVDWNKKSLQCDCFEQVCKDNNGIRHTYLIPYMFGLKLKPGTNEIDGFPCSYVLSDVQTDIMKDIKLYNNIKGDCDLDLFFKDKYLMYFSFDTPNPDYFPVELIRGKYFGDSKIDFMEDKNIKSALTFREPIINGCDRDDSNCPKRLYQNIQYKYNDIPINEIDWNDDMFKTNSLFMNFLEIFKL